MSLVLGSDYYVLLSGARDSATGAYLNTATVTYALFTSAGVAVPSGTGTCTYVAASNGDYRGTIESTVTSTLTAGQAYYVIITLVQTPYDLVKRVDELALAPGQDLVTAESWQESTGITVTGADLVSVSRLAAAVSDALVRMCYPILLQPTTLTLAPFDAPPKPELFLPRPIRSITALYLHSGANGDSSQLDLVADLLTPYEDYYAKPTDVLTGWNRTGIVYRRGAGAIWGVEYRRGIGQLGYGIDPNAGAVFINGLFGPATVSEAVREAAARAVTLLYERRKTGMPLQSESWNGYSRSNAGPFTAEGAIRSPEVMSLLQAAGVLPIHVG